MAPSTPGQLVEITDVFAESGDFSIARDDLWVFGYGSLMWRPDFDWHYAVPARLSGWHRQFTCLSVKAWGTQDRPGLSAALHPGGSVLGVAFAVAAEHRESTLLGLGRREAAYRKADVTCQLPSGRGVEGITFVANPDNGRFLERPRVADQVQHIHQGDGPKGTSMFYLQSTVRCLDDLGSGRTMTHSLLDRVHDHRQAVTNSSNSALPG